MEEAHYKLRKIIKKLESIRGRHTELVSVYVPAGYNLTLKMGQLAEEAGTAGNIQSKTVRTNVVTAIERMITQMRKIARTPPHGLAIFSGNISETEGRPDYHVFAVEPPEPLHVNMYRCDQEFVVQPLKDMLEAKNTYLLIVMELKNATLALLKGSAVIPIKEIDSGVMGKFKAGGQSANRFHQIRENQITFFMKTVAAKVQDILHSNPKLTGILVGGPGPSKEDFINNYLPQETKKKVLVVKDIGYTEEQGLRELVNKSSEILEKESITTERKLMERFMQHLAKDDGFASYGEAEVWKNLENGAVQILLLSESLPEETVEKFAAKAKEFGTELQLISEEFQEGNQLKELGGIAAVLRYKS